MTMFTRSSEKIFNPSRYTVIYMYIFSIMSCHYIVTPFIYIYMTLYASIFKCTQNFGWRFKVAKVANIAIHPLQLYIYICIFIYIYAVTSFSPLQLHIYNIYLYGQRMNPLSTSCIHNICICCHFHTHTILQGVSRGFSEIK